MTVRLNYSKQWTILILMVRAAHSIFLSLDMLKMYKKFFFVSIGTIQKIVKRKLHTVWFIRYESYDCHQISSSIISRFDGTNVVSASETNFDHKSIHYMGAYQNRPFIVGSSSGDGKQKTELMDLETGEWRTDSTDYTLQTRW